MVESLRLRVLLCAGERVRKREVGGLDEEVEGSVEALGVFGTEGRMAGMGGRGLLVFMEEEEALVTRPVAVVVVVAVGVAVRVDLLVTLEVVVGVWISGSGVVVVGGDVVRRALSLADLVIMRDTKVSSCSSMDSVAAWILIWLLSVPSFRGSKSLST